MGKTEKTKQKLNKPLNKPLRKPGRAGRGKITKTVPYKPGMEFPPYAYEPGGKKWSKTYRRAYIQEKGKEIGLYHLPRTELSKMFGCNRRTVYNDITAIYKAGVDPEALSRAKLDLQVAYEGALQIAHKNLLKLDEKASEAERSGKVKLSLEVRRLIPGAVHAVSVEGEKFTDHLERFEIKKPGELSGTPNLVVRWLEPGEGKRLKKKAEKAGRRGE